MPDKKYIIFNPWRAGFTNVFMSFEYALALSAITDRSVIIPPNVWCVLINDKSTPKDQWMDLWQIYDKQHCKQYFDLIDLLEFEDFRPFIDKITINPFLWIDDQEGHIKDRQCLPVLCDSNQCFYNSGKVNDHLDFQLFSENRPTLDVYSESKYLEITCFGHYWYNIYLGNKIERNIIKDRVNYSLRFNKKYLDLAQQVTSGFGDYNAVHIRSPYQMMFQDQPTVPDTKLVYIADRPDIVLNQCLKLYDEDKILYVSTDIENKEFFSFLKTKFNVKFLDDYGLSLNPLEKIAMDKIICSQAELFYGSFYSTFSKRINILRGLAGRQSDDYMGYNNIRSADNEILNPMPWRYTKHNHWDWWNSSYHQWAKE